MELIIIALITVEVALAIITHGRELYLVLTEDEADQGDQSTEEAHSKTALRVA